MIEDVLMLVSAQENALLIQEVNDLREQLLHYQHLKH